MWVVGRLSVVAVSLDTSSVCDAQALTVNLSEFQDLHDCACVWLMSLWDRKSLAIMILESFPNTASMCLLLRFHLLLMLDSDGQPIVLNTSARVLGFHLTRSGFAC